MKQVCGSVVVCWGKAWAEALKTYQAASLVIRAWSDWPGGSKWWFARGFTEGPGFPVGVCAELRMTRVPVCGRLLGR